ncbi:MAG: HNH endonuclease [Oscillospiraceae bacterium]
MKVHLLVAKMFVPNPHGYPVVDHKRGNKHDNRASQLEWCTIAENTRRAHALGFTPNSKKERVHENSQSILKPTPLSLFKKPVPTPMRRA